MHTDSPVKIDSRLPKRQGMNWLTTMVFALFHVGAIAALFMFSWTNLAVALFLLWMCTGLGISMGYHRLHTHRSYQVPLLDGILLCRMRRVDAGRRSDFLGCHASHPPSKIRSAGRSAFAA